MREEKTWLKSFLRYERLNTTPELYWNEAKIRVEPRCHRPYV